MDRVVSGQKVDIKADTWNKVVSLTESYRGTVGTSGDATPPRGRDLLVVNHGDSTLPRYTAVQLGPADNDVSTADEPVFEAAVPTGGGEPFAVLMEPAPKDKVVRAAISGVARAKATGTPGGFGGPSADGTIVEGGAGTARILCPGNPGVVLLNAGASQGREPFRAWASYQAGGAGWTIFLAEGPVFHWGCFDPEELEELQHPAETHASVFTAADLVEVEPVDNIVWEKVNGIWQAHIVPGTWYLAADISYEDYESLRPVSWTPAIVSEENLSEPQPYSRIRYFPIAKFHLSSVNQDATFELEQYKLGMIMLRDGDRKTLPDPEYSDENAGRVGVATSEGTTPDTALTDAWNYEPPMTSGLWAIYQHTGVELRCITRVEYSANGNQVLYGYYRNLHFSPDGRLVSISAETQTVIDTPVEYS